MHIYLFSECSTGSLNVSLCVTFYENGLLNVQIKLYKNRPKIIFLFFFFFLKSWNYFPPG